MAKVLIHNKGQRTITTAQGDLTPDAYDNFEREEADKLKRLFGKEITIVDDVAKEAEKIIADVAKNKTEKPAEAEEVEDKPLEELSAKELKVIATEKGLEFKKNASAADMLELLEEAEEEETE